MPLNKNPKISFISLITLLDSAFFPDPHDNNNNIYIELTNTNVIEITLTRSTNKKPLRIYWSLIRRVIVSAPEDVLELISKVTNDNTDGSK